MAKTYQNDSMRMCGLDRALKDVEEGRVTRWNSVEEMFKQILGDDYDNTTNNK